MANAKTNGDKRPTKPKRDMDIDELRALVKDKQLSNAEVYHKTYLSRTTVSKLLETRPGYKRTRYPSHITMQGVARAAGASFKLVSNDDH